MRFVLALFALSACAPHSSQSGDDMPTMPDAGVDGQASACPSGKAGAACVLALYDQATGCDAATVDALRTELDLRAKLGPLWANGRALFRSEAPTHVAGTFNEWSQIALATAPLCDSSLVIGVGPVPSGFHTYKLVDNNTWSLDPENPAFAYDDFTGNPDGKNSVLNTPDSGRGHLVFLENVCSQKLGNCRDVTAYYPPGYDASDTTYPVLFMHDGMNVWDDHGCCFNHTGWEINVTLDAEIAAHRVAPVVVVAADHTTARNNEYGLDQGVMADFIDFQINEIQPRALAKVRGDGHVFIAGSSLGGLVSMQAALRHPQTYAGVASLSGAFWPGMDEGVALRDQIPQMGKQPLAIYLDSGGDVSQNSDGAADTVEVRDLLVSLGWQQRCDAGPSAVCYFIQPGATHDELAWKSRAYRFLEFLFPAT
jgi:predicted alpha/beta superfamily hydrolase